MHRIHRWNYRDAFFLCRFGLCFIQRTQRYQLAQKISEINTQIRDLLDNLPLGKIISPIILKLEQEKDQAIADENYLLAEEIKQQLNKEREITRTPEKTGFGGLNA